MKLLFKLVLNFALFASFFAFVSFIFSFGLSGRSTPKLLDFTWLYHSSQGKPTDLPDFSGLKTIYKGNRPSSQIQTFYKWHDAKGDLHFSDKPPKEKTAHLETVEVDPDTNLIPGVKAPPPQPQQKPAQEATATSLPSPYSPDQIKRLFDEAHKIKQQSEQRNKQMEEIMGKAK